MPSLECDCFLRSCLALRVHRSPGAIYTLYRLPPPAAVSAGAVVGVDKRKWVWREEGWPGWTVWTVVRRLRQYWKVTMAAPSYTNICPQSAAWPVNRSEYQNINLSPSYGGERRKRESCYTLYWAHASSQYHQGTTWETGAPLSHNCILLRLHLNDFNDIT